GSHPRLPGRPRIPVQHLGPGPRARTAAGRPARRRRRALDRARVPAAPQVAGPGRRTRRGAADRAPADGDVLVLPLHRLVLPVAARRAGGARATARGRGRGYGSRGAGIRTCSIDSARPLGLISTAAPITQTSSSAVSNRTGIWVTSDSSACSGL